MGDNLFQWIPSMMVAAGATLLMSGCGSQRTDEGRVAVSGNVRQEDGPVAEGHILFRPMPGSSGFAAGGVIKDGAFAIPAAQGPSLGEYIVQVRTGSVKGLKRQGREEMKQRRAAPTEPQLLEFRTQINRPGQKLNFDVSQVDVDGGENAGRGGW